MKELYANDEVILVSYESNAQSTPRYKSASYYPAATSSSATNNQEAQAVGSRIGSAIISFNYTIAAFLIVYITVLFLPKEIQRNLVKTYKRVCQKIKNGQQKLKIEVENRIRRTDKEDIGKNRHDRVNVNRYYDNPKQEYRALYPDGDKSLFDFHTFRDEESTVHGYQKAGDSNSTKSTKKKPEHKSPLPSRMDYEKSLSIIETSFISTCSIQSAEAGDNEELSPIECIQHEKNFDTVFRNVNKKNTKPKPAETRNTLPPQEKVTSKRQEKRVTTSMAVKQEQKEVFVPKQSLLTNNESVLQPNQRPSIPPEAEATSDVFSLDTDLFSPTPNLPMVDNTKFEATKENQSRDDINILGHGGQEKSNKNILQERRVDNNAELLDTFVNFNNNSERNNISINHKTPQSSSIQTHSSSGGRSSTKLEFTPSPLSVFSKEEERGTHAIIILISSNILYPEQHVQQQNALMILLSDKFHLPVKVIDGNREKFRKNREELFRISGVRGQYPQIFIVNEGGGIKYFGNHVALDKLLQSNLGTKIFSPSLLTANAGGTVDASFFSI